MPENEIVRLRGQIRLEYEASKRGVAALACGTARHQFITAKMERLGQIHQQLTTLVGAADAIRIIAETVESLSEGVGKERENQ